VKVGRRQIADSTCLPAGKIENLKSKTCRPKGG